MRKGEHQKTTAQAEAPAEVPDEASDNVISVDFRLKQIIDKVEADAPLIAKRKALFPTLESKIAYMQCNLPTVGKNAQNEKDGWNYASIDRIVNATKELQGPLGLLITFTPLREHQREEMVHTAGHKPTLRVVVAIKMTIKDLDSGESVEHVADGDAFDPNGKSLNQAYTFGRRNCINTYFNLVTVDEARDEGDRYTHALATKPAAADARKEGAQPATTPPAPREKAVATAAHVAATADTAAAAESTGGATREETLQERGDLVAAIIHLAERKGKTLAQVNKALQVLSLDEDASLQTATAEVLANVQTDLAALPDHVIPFSQAS